MDVDKIREDLGAIADDAAKLRSSYEAVERQTLHQSMAALVDIETRVREIWRLLGIPPEEPEQKLTGES